MAATLISIAIAESVVDARSGTVATAQGRFQCGVENDATAGIVASQEELRKTYGQ